MYLLLLFAVWCRVFYQLISVDMWHELVCIIIHYTKNCRYKQKPVSVLCVLELFCNIRLILLNKRIFCNRLPVLVKAVF